MKSKKGSSNYLVRVDGNRYESSSWRRFYNHVGTIKWENKPFVYLRVSYGQAQDVFGKTQTFYNDGEYDNKSDFHLALKEFVE
jgi:hypothetical protein